MAQGAALGTGRHEPRKITDPWRQWGCGAPLQALSMSGTMASALSNQACSLDVKTTFHLMCRPRLPAQTLHQCDIQKAVFLPESAPGGGECGQGEGVRAMPRRDGGSPSPVANPASAGSSRTTGVLLEGGQTEAHRRERTLTHQVAGGKERCRFPISTGNGGSERKATLKSVRFVWGAYSEPSPSTPQLTALSKPLPPVCQWG